MLNQIILAGRLTKDVELFESKDSNKRAKLSLAVQRPFKAKNSDIFQTDFFNITLWEGIAETVAKTCKKGNIVIVRGRLEMNNYLDKETNKKVYTNNIIGERVVYLNHSYSDPDRINDELKAAFENEESVEEIEPDLKIED
ncbi:MAG: single-stranded DNA-binding protein [Gammaproteobacteria bacterium]|nr:single-stranded DNA-binding protein [Gammaproteobacteria bacterium]